MYSDICLCCCWEWWAGIHPSSVPGHLVCGAGGVHGGSGHIRGAHGRSDRGSCPPPCHRPGNRAEVWLDAGITILFFAVKFAENGALSFDLKTESSRRSCNKSVCLSVVQSETKNWKEIEFRLIFRKYLMPRKNLKNHALIINPKICIISSKFKNTTLLSKQSDRFFMKCLLFFHWVNFNSKQKFLSWS